MPAAPACGWLQLEVLGDRKASISASMPTLRHIPTIAWIIS
jgi:hypothetical protein